MLQTLLFFHILGVVGLFVGFAFEVLTLVRLRRATTLAEVHAATLNVPLIGPLMGMSTLLVLGMGIAMVYAGNFGWSEAWIDVTLVLVVIIAVLAPILIGRPLETLHRAVSGSKGGAVPQSLDAVRRSGVVNFMCFLGLFEATVALYVMVDKPAISEIVALVLLAAVIAAIPAARAVRAASAALVAQEEETDAAPSGSSPARYT